MLKYVLTFLISMIPIVELRGGIPIGVKMGVQWQYAVIICMIGNMLPVPFIFLFARKILEWGADKPVIGKFFSWCLKKGTQRRRKASGKGRQGYVLGSASLCGHSAPWYRRMDRHSGSKST